MTSHRPCLERLQEYLGRAGVAYEVTHHPPRNTAQGLAQVEHIPGRFVAKVVMVFADAQLLMIVAPATSHVDLTWVREATGALRVRLAQEYEFCNYFPDCEIGAMPPFGHLYGLPVLVDTALTRDPVIMFNAGDHRQTITMTYADFARLEQPRVGIFARAHPAA
ncbi:MAG TPA: YbaK/EbsC family protein [bacterium]|nr:YbaK/EbsC family protein [bacterium]